MKKSLLASVSVFALAGCVGSIILPQNLVQEEPQASDPAPKVSGTIVIAEDSIPQPLIEATQKQVVISSGVIVADVIQPANQRIRDEHKPDEAWSVFYENIEKHNNHDKTHGFWDLSEIRRPLDARDYSLIGGYRAGIYHDTVFGEDIVRNDGSAFWDGDIEVMRVHDGLPLVIELQSLFTVNFADKTIESYTHYNHTINEDYHCVFHVCEEYEILDIQGVFDENGNISGKVDWQKFDNSFFTVYRDTSHNHSADGAPLVGRIGQDKAVGISVATGFAMGFVAKPRK